MSVSNSILEIGSSVPWRRLLRRSLPRSQVPCAKALLLALVLPAATYAADGQQSSLNTSTMEGGRPAWLRPLGDKINSNSEPKGEPGEEGRRKNWAGWSKLEPGVLDVQAWDWLQMDLDRILDLTNSTAYQRLSPKAFEEKYLGATVEFLEIDADIGESFQIAVGKALVELDATRHDFFQKQTKGESAINEESAMLKSRADWEEYRKAQSYALLLPLAVLEELPRHQLLRETMLRWLLRLNYGIEAAAK